MRFCRDFVFIAAIFSALAFGWPVISRAQEETDASAPETAGPDEEAPPEEQAAQEPPEEPSAEEETTEEEGTTEEGATEGYITDFEWPRGAWVVRDGNFVTHLPDRDWDSRLDIMASWVRDPRLWGYRVAEAADESYEASIALTPQPIDVGVETQLLGRRGRLDVIQSAWHAGFRVEEPEASLAFGYTQRRFPSASGGSAQGFRGVESLREAYVETRITIFRLAVARSLNGGDRGGTYSNLGLYLPLSRLVVYGGANYNHRYFRRETGLSHYDVVVVLVAPSLESDDLRNVPVGGGRYLILPYWAWEFAKDDAFEDNFSFGLQLRFEF